MHRSVITSAFVLLMAVAASSAAPAAETQDAPQHRPPSWLRPHVAAAVAERLCNELPRQAVDAAILRMRIGRAPARVADVPQVLFDSVKWTDGHCTLRGRIRTGKAPIRLRVVCRVATRPVRAAASLPSETDTEEHQALRRARPATDVRAGQPVRIRAGGGLISIETAGVSLEHGDVGDQVQVRNRRSGRTIIAIVVGPGAVRLPAPEPMVKQEKEERP